MKFVKQHIRFIVINLLIGFLIVGPAISDPTLAAAFIRVMVSLMPILLTIGSGLIFKWLFRL